MDTAPVAFPSTLWTLVSHARGEEKDSQTALNTLIERYWKPVYWYVRTSCNHDATASMDLTQAFFLHLMESGFLEKADEERGRFRNFLKTSVRNFVADQRRIDHAVRRGGKIAHLTLDQAELGAEENLAAAREFGPEEVFEREWRAAVIRAAVESVRETFHKQDRMKCFEVFRLYDLEGDGQATYTAVAKQLGITEDSVSNYLRVAREAFREALKAQVRETVRSAEELADELRGLFSWLE